MITNGYVILSREAAKNLLPVIETLRSAQSDMT